MVDRRCLKVSFDELTEGQLKGERPNTRDTICENILFLLFLIMSSVSSEQLQKESYLVRH